MNKKIYFYYVALLFLLLVSFSEIIAQPDTKNSTDSLQWKQTTLPIHINQNTSFQTEKKAWFSDPYPNPTQANININLFLPVGIHNANIKISDLTGKTLKTLKVGYYTKKMSIDLSSFKKGIYFLSLYCEGNLVKSKAIILGEK